MADRTPGGQFKKGVSGNPKGMPKNPTVHALRALMGEDIEAIIRNVCQQAKAGDLVAAKMVIDRVVPQIKPISQGTISAFTPEAVAQGLKDGTLDTDSANKLLQTMLAAQQYQQNERLESMLADVSERLKRLENGV